MEDRPLDLNEDKLSPPPFLAFYARSRTPTPESVEEVAAWEALAEQRLFYWKFETERRDKLLEEEKLKAQQANTAVEKWIRSQAWDAYNSRLQSLIDYVQREQNDYKATAKGRMAECTLNLLILSALLWPLVQLLKSRFIPPLSTQSYSQERQSGHHSKP